MYRLKPANPAPAQRQRGITLIESLVALVLMALGILGILGVQMRTLADTQTGVRRAQAVRLIEDLSERIQVNPNGLGNLSQYVSPWGAASTVTCSACTPEDLAKSDIAQWKDTVMKTLPFGDANVFLAADETVNTNRRQLGVMISWRENERKNADGTTDTNYTSVFAAASTGSANVSCPSDRICHLQYIQPVGRCTPYPMGGASNPQVFCP